MNAAVITHHAFSLEFPHTIICIILRKADGAEAWSKGSPPRKEVDGELNSDPSGRSV